MRVLLTLLVYVIGTGYLPFWVPLVLALIDTAAEYAGLRLMRGLDPAARPGRYLATLALVALPEACYTVQAGLLWQHDNPYAKALATGLMTMTLLQLASVRSIHLPHAMAGLVTVLSFSVAAVLSEGPVMGENGKVVVLLICIAGAAWFVLTTMRSNHGMHDAMTRDRAAAQAADRAKSRFLAQMSHELRTPLNAILGLGHAELAAAVTPERRERLELIVASARSLGVMLDDILDLSAIEEGRTPIRPAPADPAAEIRAAIALYRPFFEGAGLSLTLNLAADLPDRAEFDAQRLRQCLTNLLSNALKHTRSGGVRISAGRSLDGLLSIEVADSGPGVAQDEAEAIFEPFRQGKTAAAGTGLGLSISRALARAMGGDLRLIQRPRGACFRLSLRIAPVERAADDSSSQPPETRAHYGGARVLIVDDIATNRLVARAHLGLYGLRCEEAADGETALARIAADPPDLVLLDMAMPGMDGAETLRRIRALPAPASRIRVVAMTVDATLAASAPDGKAPGREGGREGGLDGYLTKPLLPEAVGRLLAEQLSR
ncbi:response regulator [Paracoccaceae bacterium]